MLRTGQALTLALIVLASLSGGAANASVTKILRSESAPKAELSQELIDASASDSQQLAKMLDGLYAMAGQGASATCSIDSVFSISHPLSAAVSDELQLGTCLRTRAP